MTDEGFLLDRCSWSRPHGPHKYGELRPNGRGTVSIVHPLYCPGVKPDQD